jgi:hypothetical protein
VNQEAIRLIRSAIRIVPDVLALLSDKALKTFGYFGGQIDRLVRDLYSGSMDELEFVQTFEDLLYGQLHDAWYEGMAQNGLTKDDMTPEFETELGSIIADQNAQVLDFAEAIATQEGEDHLSGENHLDALLSRADLWQNAYLDVVNQAVIFTANAGDNYVWVFGDTEEHCPGCAALNEVVASAADWLESGLKPQNPPNDALTCGGWRCDCRLEKTDAKPTQEGPPRV